jgi:hypothetical protein
MDFVFLSHLSEIPSNVIPLLIESDFYSYLIFFSESGGKWGQSSKIYLFFDIIF